MQYEAMTWLSKRGHRSPEPLIRRRLDAGDFDDSSTIVSARQIGISDIGPQLARALEHPREDVRREAAEALLEHVDDRSVDALVATLRRQEFSAVLAAMALTRRPPASASEQLLAFLALPTSSPEWSWRTAFDDLLVRTLALLGHPEHTAKLLPHLGPLNSPNALWPWPAMRVANLALIDGPEARDLRYKALHFDGTSTTAMFAMASRSDDPQRDLELIDRKLRRDHDQRLRPRAAIASAVLDIDRPETPLDQHLNGPWNTRDLEWSYEGFSLVVALQALEQKLFSAGLPKTDHGMWRAKRLAECARALGASIEQGILCYRGRGGNSGPMTGMVFAVRDRWEKLHTLASL